MTDSLFAWIKYTEVICVIGLISSQLPATAFYVETAVFITQRVSVVQLWNMEASSMHKLGELKEHDVNLKRNRVQSLNSPGNFNRNIICSSYILCKQSGNFKWKLLNYIMKYLPSHCSVLFLFSTSFVSRKSITRLQFLSIVNLILLSFQQSTKKWYRVALAASIFHENENHSICTGTKRA